MAFKLTTYDALKIKGDVLITTDNYLSNRGIELGSCIISDKLFSVYKGEDNREIVKCSLGILDYNKLFMSIFNYYKDRFDNDNDFSNNTIVIPVEAFSAKADTFRMLYNGIYLNMSKFGKRSSVKVIFSITPYLSFDNIKRDLSIFKLDLKNYKLPKEDYTDYDLNNAMTPSVILNHIYINYLNGALIRSDSKCLLGIGDILNDITNSKERKAFAHIISPDQFKKMRNNIKGRPRKRFTKESLYRMALVLGLKFEHLLQLLNIEGYSFSPNDSLDVCMINYYIKNNDISEPGFISFLKLNYTEALRLDIINRLEEIKNLNGLI